MQAWYAIRVLGTRWGWLGPIVACKLNNVRVKISGEPGLFGPAVAGLLGMFSRRDSHRPCTMIPVVDEGLLLSLVLSASALRVQACGGMACSSAAIVSARWC